MTIASVAADDPVTASTTNQLIANVNSSPGIAIFTSNGTWSVPNGVHRFRVSLCGGGGGAGAFGVGGGVDNAYIIPGQPGGDSTMRRIWTNAEVGASYVITIGAGGAPETAGGPTSFGTLLTVAGGGAGPIGGMGAKGAPGNPTAGSLISQALAIFNASVAIYDAPLNSLRGYGVGGVSSDVAPTGAPGIVIIEW